jgi:hypothetical protein
MSRGFRPPGGEGLPGTKQSWRFLARYRPRHAFRETVLDRTSVPSVCWSTAVIGSLSRVWGLVRHPRHFPVPLRIL